MIFISYTRKDVEFAKSIRDYIQNLGYKTWMDIYDIQAGANWADEIDKALEIATAIVGVMSEASVKSNNVKNEWDWALEYNVPLFLLKIENCRIPHRYIRINYVDFTNDHKQAFDKLQTDLKNPPKIRYSLDKGDIYLPIRDLNSNTKLSTQEQNHVAPEPLIKLDDNAKRNRERMLKKVHDFWIRDVLEKSLHGAALIELGIVQKQDSVNHPWKAILEHDDYADKIQIGVNIQRFFDQMSGELLVLGDPGSGKTTMLLELARDLLTNAEKDINSPIPVIFNLSSWADERKPITEWLIYELNTKYQVPKTIASEWVKTDALILLLDGLDEIRNIPYREACIDALNQYRMEHALTPIVVCSRTKDYENLRNKLKLYGAVIIQPLSVDQIDEYLNSFGDKLTTLRNSMKYDKSLQELAQSPLMLSIMAIAYKDISLHELFELDTPEKHKKHLFDMYIKKVITRNRGRLKYSEEDCIKWLHWLAYKMREKSQTVFLIENLQPDWFDNKKDARIQLIFTKLILALFLSIPSGIFCGIAGHILFDLHPIVFGLGVFISSGVTVYITFRSPHRSKNRLMQGLIISICYSATVGISVSMNIGIIDGIFFTAMIFMSVIVVSLPLFYLFGSVIKRPFSKNQEKITYIYPIDKLNWSWGNFFTSLRRLGLIVGLALGLGFGIIGFSVSPNIGLISFLAFGLSGLLIVGVWNGFTGNLININVRPNDGIFRSAQNALYTGLTTALISSIPIILIFSIFLHDVFVGLLVGLAVAYYSGVIAFGIFGGGAVFQHLILRFILQSKDVIPSNYSKFLNNMPDIVLLRRVGGGYIFIHRSMLEYFADLDNGARLTV